MALFQRRGFEDRVGSAIVVIIAFTIDRIEGEGASRQVYGSFRLKDYAEHGIEGDHEYRATEQPEGSWLVEATESNFWQDKSGKFHFTLDSHFNRGAAEYVATKIVAYLANPTHTHEAPVQRLQEPGEYQGPCICDRMLNKSYPKVPSVTPRFAKRCFICSCGRRWWEYDTEQHKWAPVPNWPAWQMLTLNDGEPIKQISILTKCPWGDDGVYLVEWLVQAKGWIALG